MFLDLQENKRRGKWGTEKKERLEAKLKWMNRERKTHLLFKDPEKYYTYINIYIFGLTIICQQ